MRAAFVVSEKNGVWGKAIRMPGMNKASQHAHHRTRPLNGIFGARRTGKANQTSRHS
jgi:hypothetical protein